MDFYKINKKRKLICAFSLLCTVLIILLYAVLSIIFGRAFILVPILGVFVMLALLYCLSKFIVYKYYLQIKTLIVNEALKREVKANEIIDLDNKNDFIFHFYNKADVTIKSSFQFVYDNGKIETKEFEVQSKNNFKNKVVLAGKHIKYSLVDNYNDVLFIKNFDKETDKYLSYFEGQFEKKDDNIFISSSKRYVCLYNEKPNVEILKIFEKINGFHMLYIKDNVLNIIFIDNTPIFDFKLTKMVDNKTVNAASQCFNKLSKLIISLRKVVK